MAVKSIEVTLRLNLFVIRRSILLLDALPEDHVAIIVLMNCADINKDIKKKKTDEDLL